MFTFNTTTQRKQRKRHTLRALLINLPILLHTSHTGISRNLAEPRRSFVHLIRVTGAYTSGDWLRPYRYAVVAISHKVVVASDAIAINGAPKNKNIDKNSPFVILRCAFTTFFVLNGVLVLLPDVTIHIRLSAPVPLLHFTHSISHLYQQHYACKEDTPYAP
jgi:hypothetical protein